MDSFTLIGISLLVVGIVGFIVFGKSKDQIKEKIDKTVEKTSEKVTNVATNKKAAEVSKQDIFDFMEFEKIQDDMIIQKGNKYTMVVKCQGINYELLSQNEKISVEEGFVTFLNTLRFPVQLFVESSRLNIKESVRKYKDNVEKSTMEIEEMQKQYKALAKSPNTTQAKLDELAYEINKKQNILEYLSDITYNVESMSLNKNMLQRKYYVVISYYKSDIGLTGQFNDDEIYEICNRELYTRAESIVSALTTCSIHGHILDSNELAELLYRTYNRDDSELMNLRETLDSGFFRLYSTAEDVFAKKREQLQAAIQLEAIERAKAAIKEAEKRRLEADDDDDQSIEDVIDSVAEDIIDKVGGQLPEDIAQNAKKKINKDRRTRKEKEKAEIAERLKEDEEIEIQTVEEKPKVEEQKTEENNQEELQKDKDNIDNLLD